MAEKKSTGKAGPKIADKKARKGCGTRKPC